MAGAAFEVRTGDGSSGIVVGTLAEFPDAALDGPLTIRDHYDGREAYVIRTDPERVRLIGATDLGASLAAFRFLELLGCRWFFPAPEWEVVPSSPELKFDAEETDRPTILSRRIWYGWGFFHDRPAPKSGTRPAVPQYTAAGDYKSWRDTTGWRRRWSSTPGTRGRRSSTATRPSSPSTRSTWPW